MQEHYLYDVAAIDVEDLRALMEHYGEDVWKYAYFLTGDPHLADDIAQETFIRAYRGFHTFRRESSVKSWLLKITRNTAFTAQRRAFLRKAVLLDSRSPDGSPSVSAGHRTAPSAEETVIAYETEAELWQVIMELPRKFRDPLILRFHYQFSMEEIAEILNISVGTVKSRIHRAKQKAANILKGRKIYD